MTQLELQDILSEEILKVKDSEKCPRETQTKILDSAMTISSLAKQMINNADVILRRDLAAGKHFLNEDAPSRDL